MRIRFGELVFLIITVLSFILLISITKSVTMTSPMSHFNVSTDAIFLNYTNNFTTSISIGVVTAGNLNISNVSTGVMANYSQIGSQPSYCSPLGLFVINGSGSASVDLVIVAGTYQNITIYNNFFNCLPGRYFGGLRIQNITNTTENITINVTVDMPVKTSNVLSSLNGNGTFTAQMQGNATYFHRYFFNSSEIENATAVTINLTTSTGKDIDIFLFDNSTAPVLVAKSIGKNSSNESLVFSFLPFSKVYELRVFGNISDASPTYVVSMHFTTLNITNASNPAQLIPSIDFGTMYVTNITKFNLTLKNEGNLTLNGVRESSELYYVKRWSDNASKDFSFLVPDFAQKIKVFVNWTSQTGINTTNYTIYLTAPNGTLVSKSSNKYLNANFTNATLEDYIELVDNTKGYWNVSIRNETILHPSILLNNYTTGVYVWINTNDWITTNYSTSGFNFNRTMQDNTSNYTIQLNFTVPNNGIDGIYEGFMQYKEGSGAIIRMPINVNISSPTLIVNGTINSTSLQVDENVGITTSKVFNITYNNTGTQSLAFTVSNSSSSLKLGPDTSKYINFSYSLPSSPIPAGGSGVINISISINGSIANTSGMYEGWLFLNATDTHPYQGFNLSLKVNLTTLLDVRIISIETSNDPNGNFINFTDNYNSTNHTAIRVRVYFVNGTEITSLSITNFTSVWLQEGNVSGSTGRIFENSNLTIFNGTPDLYTSNRYNINITVPTGQVGGLYDIHLTANYYTGPYIYGGEGIYRNLILNNTGLYMNTSTGSISIANTSQTSFTVNLYNYGPLTASSAIVAFSYSGCAITSVYVSASNPCSGSVTSSTASPYSNVTFSSIPGLEIRNCNNITWTFTGTGSGSCTATIYGTTHKWFNNISLPITVTATAVNVTTTTTTTAPTVEAAKYMDITSYDPLIQIAQGNSTTSLVTVKNTNTTKTQDIKLSVENITSTWFTVSPALVTVSPGNSTTFTVTFTIPSDAEMKNYDGIFRAISNYANISKSFTLKVLPSEEQKTNITQTLASYRANMTQLSLEINQSKSKGLNVTFAEAKLLELKVKIEQAEGYINQGDYFNAYQLLSSIQTLIDETKAELAAAKAITGEAGLPFKLEFQSWMIYAIIGGGAAVAVFLAFLFWPKGKPKIITKEIPAQKIKGIFEKPKELIQPKEVSAWEQLREKWAKIKKEKK